jgi:hypothetical protein
MSEEYSVGYSEGYQTGRNEAIDELEQENRLLRARNDRLEAEANTAPVQEHVAWGKPTDEMVQAATDEYDEWAVDNKGTTECIRAMLVKALKATPPAAKRQWVSLNYDEQYKLIKQECRYNSDAAYADNLALIKAADKMLKDKNS